jgi:repressor of nif and glnA expression
MMTEQELKEVLNGVKWNMHAWKRYSLRTYEARKQIKKRRYRVYIATENTLKDVKKEDVLKKIEAVING